MAGDTPDPPFIYEGLDPAAETDRFGITKLSAAIKSLSDIVAEAKKPGMPLSILSNVAREAPFGLAAGCLCYWNRGRPSTLISSSMNS